MGLSNYKISQQIPHACPASGGKDHTLCPCFSFSQNWVQHLLIAYWRLLSFLNTNFEGTVYLNDTISVEDGRQKHIDMYTYRDSS